MCTNLEKYTITPAYLPEMFPEIWYILAENGSYYAPFLGAMLLFEPAELTD